MAVQIRRERERRAHKEEEVTSLNLYSFFGDNLNAWERDKSDKWMKFGSYGCVGSFGRWKSVWEGTKSDELNDFGRNFPH